MEPEGSQAPATCPYPRSFDLQDPSTPRMPVTGILCLLLFTLTGLIKVRLS